MRVGDIKRPPLFPPSKVSHLWFKTSFCYERACKPDYLTTPSDINFNSDKPPCKKCIKVLNADHARAAKALKKLGVEVNDLCLFRWA